MSKNSKRMEILEQINSGQITAEEGAIKLDNLSAPKQQASEVEAEDDRMTILEKIERGKLSPDEGAQKLKNAQPAQRKQMFIYPDASDNKHVPPEDLKRWRSWWLIPLWVGMLIAALSGYWMNAAYLTSGVGFWFLCSWLPLSVGLLLILMGSLSNSSRWLHIRIKEAGRVRPNIAISLPIPIRFAGWLLNTFGRLIPGLNDSIIDEIIVAMENDTLDNPFHIHIDDDKDGDQVDVYIG